MSGAGRALTRRVLRPYLAQLAAWGVEILDARQGRHLRLRVRTPAGRVRMITLPVSPSDHRGYLNWRDQVWRSLFLPRDTESPHSTLPRCR